MDICFEFCQHNGLNQAAFLRRSLKKIYNVFPKSRYSLSLCKIFSQIFHPRVNMIYMFFPKLKGPQTPHKYLKTNFCNNSLLVNHLSSLEIKAKSFQAEWNIDLWLWIFESLQKIICKVRFVWSRIYLVQTWNKEVKLKISFNLS